MMNKSDIRIVINENEFTEWIRYDIESDLLQPADAFSFVANNAYGKLKGMVAKHDKVEVYVEGTLQLTGYVDDVNWRVSADEGAVVEIIGRDIFGQLIDNSLDPQEIRNKDLEQIAKLLCAPWVTNWIFDNEKNRRILQRAQNKLAGVKREMGNWKANLGENYGTEDYRIGSEIGKEAIKAQQKVIARLRNKVYPRVKVEPGDNAITVIEKHAKAIGMIVWATAGGDGIIGLPNYEQQARYKLWLYPPTKKECALNNVLTANVTESGRDQFFTYRGLGSSANSASTYASATRRDVRASDNAVSIPRHLIITTNGQNLAAAQKEVVLERQRREFEALTLNYTAKGHGQENNLWQIDTLCSVDDQVNGFSDDYYITRRRFSGDQNGQITELTMHRKGLLMV